MQACFLLVCASLADRGSAFRPAPHRRKVLQSKAGVSDRPSRKTPLPRQARWILAPPIQLDAPACRRAAEVGGNATASAAPPHRCDPSMHARPATEAMHVSKIKIRGVQLTTHPPGNFMNSQRRVGSRGLRGVAWQRTTSSPPRLSLARSLPAAGGSAFTATTQQRIYYASQPGTSGPPHSRAAKHQVGALSTTIPLQRSGSVLLRHPANLHTRLQAGGTDGRAGSAEQATARKETPGWEAARPWGVPT